MESSTLSGTVPFKALEVLPPANQVDMSQTHCHFEAKEIPLPETEHVLESSGPPRWFHQAAPDRQVILAYREATSGAASTGVAGLEAPLEVA